MDIQELNGKSEESCELFRDVLTECALAEHALADEQYQHESKLEQLVGKPLFDVLDKELPNISKLRRSLAKYVLDKDSAKNRYNSVINMEFIPTAYINILRTYRQLNMDRRKKVLNWKWRMQILK